MWKYLYFVAVFCSRNYLAAGHVWPKPQREEKGTDVYLFEPASFEFKAVGSDCPLLLKAIKRYGKIIGYHGLNSSDVDYLQKMMQLYNPLQKLKIYLSGECEEYPQLDMDESYSLTISRESELWSNSVWGILRGLETFAQLFELASSDYKIKRIRATNIEDFPRYEHRGFLIDTARHYYSPAFILTHLEAMAVNKYNVLHWHITDAESFPYQSEKFPELSRDGAFYSYRVYDKNAIRKIVDFAAERGIRVIPEINMPAHTRSWGMSHPEVLTRVCLHTGILNPARNSTYSLIHDLIEELRHLFPDKYMHLGGNNVNLQCWLYDKEVYNYIYVQRNMSTLMMFDRFVSKVAEFLSDRIPIYWEDVYRKGVMLPANSTVQIWQIDRNLDDVVENIQRIIKRGWRVLYSRKWRLDLESTTMKRSYQLDPRSGFFKRTGIQDMLDKIVGGEACLWSDGVDASNFHDMAWPRAVAIAEVLWSARELNSTPEVPLHRIRGQMKRMHDRGLPVNLNSKYL